MEKVVKPKKGEERFFISYEQKTVFGAEQILVDKNTGVNYLFMQSSYSGGLTVLLDAEGKPVITPTE